MDTPRDPSKGDQNPHNNPPTDFPDNGHAVCLTAQRGLEVTCAALANRADCLIMSAALHVLLVPLLLVAYYASVRLWLRRDIEPDAVVVQYRPPDDLSPAELRLADCGCTDATSIAAMIAQLGHKGALSAVRQPNGNFLLIRRIPLNNPMLSPEELAVFRKIFDHYLGAPAPNESTLSIPKINDVPDPIAPLLRSTILAPSLAEDSSKRMSASTA